MTQKKLSPEIDAKFQKLVSPILDATSFWAYFLLFFGARYHNLVKQLLLMLNFYLSDYKLIERREHRNQFFLSSQRR